MWAIDCWLRIKRWVWLLVWRNKCVFPSLFKKYLRPRVTPFFGFATIVSDHLKHVTVWSQAVLSGVVSHLFRSSAYLGETLDILTLDHLWVQSWPSTFHRNQKLIFGSFLVRDTSLAQIGSGYVARSIQVITICLVWDFASFKASKRGKACSTQPALL